MYNIYIKECKEFSIFLALSKEYCPFKYFFITDPCVINISNSQSRVFVHSRTTADLATNKESVLNSISSSSVYDNSIGQKNSAGSTSMLDNVNQENSTNTTGTMMK